MLSRKFTWPVILLGLLLSYFKGNSQWINNPALNNPICTASFKQLGPRLVNDSKGGAIITWEDYRNDPTQSSADVFAQRISKDGVVKWTVDGIPVCTGSASQLNPVICEDGTGGAFIVWEDLRSGKRNLFAQRIDSLGNALWTANGIAVDLQNRDQRNPKILYDGNNGFIAVYQDSVTNAYDIHATRIGPNGNVIWTGAISVCNAAGSQINPKAILNSTGIIVTWQDKRNGVDYNIYAQALSLSNGTALWATNGISICSIGGAQINPKIVSDNIGGAFIAWQDKRYGFNYDVYAQRVNGTGAVQWTANGKIVSNANNSQSAIDMTSDGTGTNCIITWKDERNGSSNYDIYAQMCDASGNMLWTANGNVVCAQPNSQLNPNIIGDGNGGAIIVYQDSAIGKWDVRMQRLNSSGIPIWNAAGVDVGIASGEQQEPKNIHTGNGESIITFQDDRSGSNDIYAFKIDGNGVPVSLSENAIVHQSILIYPQPARDFIFIKFISAEGNSSGEINLYDVTGRLVLNKSTEGNTEVVIPCSHLSGMFYVVFSCSGKCITDKVVIGN